MNFFVWWNVSKQKKTFVFGVDLDHDMDPGIFNTVHYDQL